MNSSTYLKYMVNDISFLHSYQYLILYYIPGYQSYTSNVDDGDYAMCQLYVRDKPSPVCQEFTELAQILMDENDLAMPQNCEEALALYIELVDIIENA